MRKTRSWTQLSVAAAVLASLTSGALAGSTVYVVHGIPGGDTAPTFPVDISVDGACTLPGFEFGDIAGPLPFEAGMYDIAISPADEANPCGQAPVLEAMDVELFDGENYSIVAHLTEAGAPTASVFVNDIGTKRYASTVNVFHTAAAPTVDIELERDRPRWWPVATLEGVSNGDNASVKVLYGNWEASIFPAGANDAVFGPATLSLAKGTAYGVYAVGAFADETFTVLVTTLEDAPPATADVYVVHGIPGEDLGADPALPVDVSVNGVCALPGFTFGEVVGPLPFDAGTTGIAISLANETNPCGNAPVIEANGVEIVGGENYSIVAHLTETGDPTASVFTNNLKAPSPFARVNVFHTAAAPAVDIEFERDYWWTYRRYLDDVANGESGDLLLIRGDWDASIFPAGGDTAVFGPASLSLDKGVSYLVYAVGSLANDTFTLLTAVAESN